ncbi:LysR family transcriptional regulator [Actinoalloteichus hymeniacidonis]|uniref:Transcriptional regulator n=1 Tax=Actinoalloteichus hymeniacidonis TaxID=340345 RepID=A0AAC9HRK2_9PSEU|nr:LysR family transcriptional regulator [Actinoalloteichus hymeniacidonis]AOS64128.1 transcriptional regulator [Actinoalloteichus hymeniacidonis]MBB5907807.1 DNA-binding transcriptional LysR family regulator [Actinoalloteichus hymeniacidonis]
MVDVSLDLLQLRTFVAIEDCGGFGRAASVLRISQPTVSQHVRQLERRLRQTLVEKDGRRARFTAAGERLLVEARRIMAVHDEALNRLTSDTRTGLVIGSAETAAEQVLPELLSSLRDAYPGRPVRFHLDRSTQLIDSVDRGLVDLAVILGFPGDIPGRLVGNLPLRWYAAPGWQPPARSDPWPLVAYREPCGMRQRALQRLGEADRTVDVVAESTSVEGVIAAVRAGLGVAVLPSAGRAPSGLTRLGGLPDLGSIGVHLATRRGLDLNLETAALDVLESFFGSLDIPWSAGSGRALPAPRSPEITTP